MGDLRDPAPAEQEDQKKETPRQGAAQSDPDDPGCLVKDDGVEKCPKAPEAGDDDDAPIEDVRKLMVSAVEGDALKPVIVENLAFAQGKDTARKDIHAAYEKAFHDSLKKDYDDADKRFKAIAEGLAHSVGGTPSRLETWIKRWLADDGEITKLFEAQRQKAERLLARSGPRECELRKAEDKTKLRKQAYEDWKSPGTKIKAIIDGYKDKLPQLSCDIHDGDQDGDQYAIHQFWFVVAPQHLQLRPEPVRKSNAPGLDLICNALTKYPARRRALLSAKERNDGSLFLIDPGALDAHRKTVLESWEAAVRDKVTKQVDYTFRPDDAASLAKDLAKLAADEPPIIKKLLQAKP